MYRIECPKKLNSSVTIRIQHELAEESLQNLCFITCIDDKPPFDYSVLHGGNFTSEYGEISVKRFSFYSIGRLLTKYRVKGALCLLEKSYQVSLYRSVFPTTLSSTCSWKIYLSVTKNCSIFRKSVVKYIQEEYRNDVKLISCHTARFDGLEKCISVQHNCNTDSPRDVKVEELGNTSLQKIDISGYVDGHPPLINFSLLAKPGCSLRLSFKLVGFQKPVDLVLHCSELPGKLLTLFSQWCSTKLSFNCHDCNTIPRVVKS